MTTTAGGSKQVIVADVVNVPAGEVEVIRDERGRITRLRRHGIAGSILVNQSQYENRDPPPIERPRLPAPTVRGPLDRNLIWAPPPKALEIYESCLARVAARGVTLPPYELNWASASPLTRYPRGLVMLRAGRLRLVLNTCADDLERTIAHELGHVADAARYSAMFTPEELAGAEVQRELDKRAEAFASWVLSSDPPELYRSPHNERRWYV